MTVNMLIALWVGIGVFLGAQDTFNYFCGNPPFENDLKRVRETDTPGLNLAVSFFLPIVFLFIGLSWPVILLFVGGSYVFSRLGRDSSSNL